MKTLHILAGSLAILAGFLALYAGKGSPLHRRSGLVFVLAMLVMCASAALMAAFLRPNAVNVLAALLTTYLIGTSLLGVRYSELQTRPVIAALMLMALLLAAFAFDLALTALRHPRGVIEQVPAPPLFMFGAVALIAAAMDARLLWVGRLQGAPRLARHLWRMTYAMWIATSSFFLGQAKFFPQPLRKLWLLAIPVLIVTVLLFYWLWKVQRKPRQTQVAAMSPHPVESR